MPRYDEDYGTSQMTRQRDLVLSVNEFCFLQNKTNGQIKTHVGPLTTTISQQEALVRFNTNTKKFEEIADFDKAKQLFISAPEGWYVTLKNPIASGIYPEAAKANNTPADMAIGTKVNIPGPVSFAMFPGQMAKVVKGHSLRSNQYLLARVYEAEAANKNKGEILDAEGNTIETKQTYVNGQLLVIKGTEISYYIPPTGIEVISEGSEYTREAVTLERLEYCILKDEDGNKRYVHGPEVVFPEPTEIFVSSPKGGFIFKAIELSPISGIYAKVIAAYTDEKGVQHPVGEELFVTGNDQMIYYPRPEHAIISYDNKIVHHAIAIPEGEGRYVMNRLTGEITTVKGPAMFLPDPRTQVIVKRKLSKRECDLMYPGNALALEYNIGLTEKAVEKSLKSVNLDEVTAYCCTNSLSSSLANLESKASMSRGTSYTKPRTITLDNKFEGVVSVDVWTGYAVDVVSKNGERKVVCGPQTILLDYDQVLEELQMSTGRPKTTDHLLHTVFLRHENNKISDLINVETKDFVRATVKVSYCVNFDPKYMDKWFNVDNYVKYLCDRVRSLVKRESKKYTIEEFWQNYSEIIRNTAIARNAEKSAEESAHEGRFFEENGMYIHDCEVLSIEIEPSVAKLLNERQYRNVSQSLELADAEKRVTVAKALAEAEKEEQLVRSQKLINKMALEREEALKKLAIEEEVAVQKRAAKSAEKQAEKDLQPIVDAIREAELARTKKEKDQIISYAEKQAEIEKAKQEAYAETVVKIMSSVQPGLIKAMQGATNAEMFEALAQGIAPYAMAKDESAAEFVSTLLRGTTLENIVNKMETK